jgi:hypothetical protein
MSLRTEIRRANSNDVDAIEQFYQFAFKHSGPYKYPERWNWLNRHNPFIPKNQALPVWIAVQDGKIIGHTGAMYVPLRIKGKTRAAAWSIDTVVLPVTRGQGIGKKLQLANQSAQDIFISLTRSKINRIIKAKIGGAEGPEFSLFYFSKKIDAALLIDESKLQSILLSLKVNITKPSRKILIDGLTCTISSIAQILLKCFQTESLKNNSGHLHFKRIDFFDQKADQFWDKIKDRYDLAVERTSAYLNWKFKDQPFIKYQHYYVYHKEKLEGIVILRLAAPPEPPVGIICECLSLYDSTEHLQIIIANAKRILIKQGAIGVYCGSSALNQEMALRRNGFLKLWSYPLMIYFKNLQDKPLSLFTALLSKGDHDLDEYPRANQITLSDILNIFKKNRPRIILARKMASRLNILDL